MRVWGVGFRNLGCGKKGVHPNPKRPPLPLGHPRKRQTTVRSVTFEGVHGVYRAWVLWLSDLSEMHRKMIVIIMVLVVFYWQP